MRIIGVLAGAFLFLTICVADPALAAGIVGTGTPASCTEAVLDAALAGGGAVTFNCGPSPVTMPVTHQTTIKKKTNIDGGGLITLSGSPAGVFEVRGKTTLSNLAFADNIASGGTAKSGTPGGGAIRNFSTLIVTNCAFSRNSAGTAQFVLGGALENIGGKTMVTNCTFSANSAAVGSEISNDRCTGGCGKGGLTLRNTIVNNGSGGNCAGVPITDGGHNLDSRGLCGLGPATDPLLDPAGLATNGGPTQTIALQPGSPPSTPATRPCARPSRL